MQKDFWLQKECIKKCKVVSSKLTNSIFICHSEQSEESDVFTSKTIIQILRFADGSPAQNDKIKKPISTAKKSIFLVPKLK
jgi:hypothetical protein